MIKKILLIFSLPLFIVIILYLAGVYHNNRELAYPSDEVLTQAQEQSIQWLKNHETDILSETNPMLWWMLYEVHKTSQDQRIADLLDKYFGRNSRMKNSLWGPLFDGVARPTLGAYSVEGLPYYNQHFIYALNCAADLANELPVVNQQNDAGFCWQGAYFYRPACVTHQLMGINFLYTRQCNLLPDIDLISQSLQLDIIQQLTWDIRVVDVYLQRVLMLLITGAEASVKPVWIQRVLDHQLADGGWGNFQALLGPLGDKSFGFSSRVVSFSQEKSSFHATAQGLYILTFLLSEKDQG